MKTLRLNIPPHSNLWVHYNLANASKGYYYYSGHVFMVMPLAGPSGKGVMSLRNSGFFSCREDVAHYGLRTRLQRMKEPEKAFDRARVIFYKRIPANLNTNADQATAAVKIANLFESEFGWPLTEVYRLENEDVHPNNEFYYFEGDKKWIHSPQLISFYLLILRMSFSLSKKNAELVSSKKKLSTLLPVLMKRCVDSDAVRFRKIHKDVIKMLNNYDALFADRTMRSLFVKSGGFIKNEGVEKFLRNDTVDKELVNAWRNLP